VAGFDLIGDTSGSTTVNFWSRNLGDGLQSPYGNALPTLRKEYEVFSLPRGEYVPASSKEARFRKNQTLRPMRSLGRLGFRHLGACAEINGAKPV
jgi:hypothetical protein